MTHGDIMRWKDLKPWEIGVASVLIALIFVGGLHPTTFTAPLEASSNATRLMSYGVPGGRPAWDDDSMQIDSKLNPVSYTHLTLPTNREV